MSDVQTRTAEVESAAEQAQEYAGRGYEEVQQYVRHYPLAASLLVFGFGLGLGMVVGMGTSRPRYIRIRDRRVPERLGRQVLEAIASVLPEQWGEQLKS